MARFLVDEDLPRWLVDRLKEAGSDGIHVKEVGLQGQPDSAVFSYAKTHGYSIITEDLDFSNPIRFPLGSHPGILISRHPNELSCTEQCRQIVLAIKTLTETDIVGNIIILSVDNIRIKRPGT